MRRHVSMLLVPAHQCLMMPESEDKLHLLVSPCVAGTIAAENRAWEMPELPHPAGGPQRLSRCCDSRSNLPGDFTLQLMMYTFWPNVWEAIAGNIQHRKPFNYTAFCAGKYLQQSRMPRNHQAAQIAFKQSLIGRRLWREIPSPHCEVYILTAFGTPPIADMRVATNEHTAPPPKSDPSRKQLAISTKD